MDSNQKSCEVDTRSVSVDDSPVRAQNHIWGICPNTTILTQTPYFAGSLCIVGGWDTRMQWLNNPNLNLSQFGDGHFMLNMVEKNPKTARAMCYCSTDQGNAMVVST